MKNKPILRYFLVGIIHGLMYVLGVVLFPLYFPLKRVILNFKIPFLIWFLNTDEGYYVANIYGDKGYRIKRGFDYDNSSIFRKVYEGFIWLAIRNSHYWFRLNVLHPKIGNPYNVNVIINETDPVTNGMTFCNMSIWGKQYAKYYVEGVKYFRYSFTKRTPGILKFIGFNDYMNLHMGWASTRWILKLRFFN